MKLVYLLLIFILSSCDTNSSSISVIMDGKMFIGQYHVSSIAKPVSVTFIYQSDKVLNLNNLNIALNYNNDNNSCIKDSVIKTNEREIPSQSSLFNNDRTSELRMKYSFDQGVEFASSSKIELNVCDKEYHLSDDDLKNIKEVAKEWTKFISK